MIESYNIIAMVIGYSIIGASFIWLARIIILFCYHYARLMYYKSFLWWIIHTQRVKKLTLSKMVNSSDFLIKVKVFVINDCPPIFKKVWINKIDEKLSELRKEIESHGEVPTF